MRIRGWLAVAALLSGCGGNPQADLSARLSTLVGQCEAEVIRRMGPPRGQVAGPGGQVDLQYQVFWPYGGGPNFAIGPNQPMGRSCDITLRMAAGKLASYQFTGDLCGVGGLPYIAP